MADFSHVPPAQREIDLRLWNWRRWATVHGSRFTQPMFRLYRPPQNESDGYRHEDSPPPIDPVDALKVERAIVKLPEKNKLAIVWAYRIGIRPVIACKALAVSKDGLAALILDGRQMLVNRGV